MYQESLGDSEISFDNYITELEQTIEETTDKWAKVEYGNFDKYKEVQKVRKTTPEILDLIQFIDNDIRKSFDNVQVRMSNTHYAFFIGTPGNKGNRFFAVSPEKDKLRIGFKNQILNGDKIPDNAVVRNSWPDTFSIYINTKEQYTNQIKLLADKSYHYAN